MSLSVSKLDFFNFALRKSGLPQAALEYRFHPKRKWRFDWAWPACKLAIEYEGGTFAGGRHVRGLGYSSDCEKYSEAALLGWTVVRITADMVSDGRAFRLIESLANLYEEKKCSEK